MDLHDDTSKKENDEGRQCCPPHEAMFSPGDRYTSGLWSAMTTPPGKKTASEDIVVVKTGKITGKAFTSTSTTPWTTYTQKMTATNTPIMIDMKITLLKIYNASISTYMNGVHCSLLPSWPWADGSPMIEFAAYCGRVYMFSSLLFFFRFLSFFPSFFWFSYSYLDFFL